MAGGEERRGVRAQLCARRKSAARFLERRERGAISVYAQADDYHDLIKGKLKRIAQWLAAEAGGELKVFVDTAPVMEKPLAEAAGLGWQGKHTNVVSREFGSWLFLGALFTTLELPLDAPEPDHCGSCRACLDICPTEAFPAPYQLDARRCISYLTIEHKGPIPREFREKIGNRIYGCDDCLAVCPWNKFAQVGREAKLAARVGEPCSDLGRTLPPRRRGFPQALHEKPGQAHRPRALRAQCLDRDRQFRRHGARPRSRAALGRPLAAGAGCGSLGAVAARGARCLHKDRRRPKACRERHQRDRGMELGLDGRQLVDDAQQPLDVLGP